MQTITISLEDEIFQFIEQQAQGNSSSYINNILKKHRQLILAAEMIKALKEDAENSEYLAELAEWETIVGDGIEEIY